MSEPSVIRPLWTFIVRLEGGPLDGQEQEVSGSPKQGLVLTMRPPTSPMGTDESEYVVQTFDWDAEAQMDVAVAVYGPDAPRVH